MGFAAAAVGAVPASSWHVPPQPPRGALRRTPETPALAGGLGAAASGAAFSQMWAGIGGRSGDLLVEWSWAVAYTVSQDVSTGLTRSCPWP